MQRKRSRTDESPRTTKHRGLSETATPNQLEGSFDMSNVPSPQPVFVFDLLDGKSEDDAQFYRERATRHLQQDAHEKMETFDLHPLEYLAMFQESYAREREDWGPTADGDLIQNTSELIEVMDRCLITGTDGKSQVSVTQLVADNADSFGVVLEEILTAVNGYLHQHYRITAETVVSIANNALADQDGHTVPGVEHPSWCNPEQCHVYDDGESVVHRREFHGFDGDGSEGLRLFTVSQCDGEARPVIPDFDAGDFDMEEIPELARVLLQAYEHMTGQNPIEALMSEGGAK